MPSITFKSERKFMKKLLLIALAVGLSACGEREEKTKEVNYFDLNGNSKAELSCKHFKDRRYVCTDNNVNTNDYENEYRNDYENEYRNKQSSGQTQTTTVIVNNDDYENNDRYDEKWDRSERNYPNRQKAKNCKSEYRFGKHFFSKKTSCDNFECNAYGDYSRDRNKLILYYKNNNCSNNNTETMYL